MLLGGIFLAVWYTAAYLAHPALPGNNPTYPAGWWGWWDQSNYLKSALALARRNFSPDQHLYPLGYAITGAPFVRLWPMHPFYFVDLASLLISLAGFVSVARRCNVAPRWSVLLFVLAAAADPVLFEQWVVPWTTTPAAAVVWLLLAVAAAHMEGRRHPVLLGLLAVCLPILRPTDVLLAVPPLAACLLVDLRTRRLALRDVLGFAVAVLLMAGLYAGLHLKIYGLAPSYYMTMSANTGFSLHHFGWKAYLILVDPTAWIGGGEGLLRRAPWMILGVAGIVPALRRPIPAMLAVTLAIHSLFYLSYVDLLPTGFWRYMNVHYWVWSFPGFALLALLLVRDVLQRGRRLLAVASCACVITLLCIHLDPTPAAQGEAADALDFRVDSPSFEAAYFGDLKITDAEGILSNVQNIRSIPLPGTIRVLTLTRALHGDITADGEGLNDLTPTRLRVTPRFGIPFWPWRKPDAAFGPR
jgi:hypothetical protein